MKKLFVLVAVLALGVATVNAQAGTWYVGTTGVSLGAGVSDTGFTPSLFTGVTSQGDDTAWGISPEIGYNLNDNIALGLGLGYSSWGDDNNAWGLNPYVRWYGWKTGDFSVYFQANVEYFAYELGNADTNRFGINVAPGIAYMFNDHFGINAAFGTVGYSKVKDNDGVFNLGLNSGIAFSLTYTF